MAASTPTNTNNTPAYSTGPATGHFDITPGAAPMEAVVRSIFVGVAGNVECICNGTTCIYQNLPAAYELSGNFTHVLATNTTATGLIGRL